MKDLLKRLFGCRSEWDDILDAKRNYDRAADELRRAGIDPEKMGYLSGRERRLILRRAGLDPDKYDF